MFRISLRAVIEHDGQFLLAKNNRMGDYWALPGGGWEEGEEITEALKRELMEETGIRAHVGNLLFIHQVVEDGKYSPPGLFFHVTNGKDFLSVDHTKTSHGPKELEKLEFCDVTKVKLLPRFLSQELPELATQNFDTKPQIRITQSEA